MSDHSDRSLLPPEYKDSTDLMEKKMSMTIIDITYQCDKERHTCDCDRATVDHTLAHREGSYYHNTDGERERETER